VAEKLLTIVTIPERKERETRRKTEAINRIIGRLRDFVRTSNGAGRFVVFGSAASDAIRHGSDFDVLIDFAETHERAAWHEVEDACRAENIRADILSVRMIRAECVAKILARSIKIIA